MSFGFSPSDIVSLISLTTKVYQGWRDACGEYADITATLHSLQINLKRVEAHFEAQDRAQHVDQAHVDGVREDLGIILSACNGSVRQFEAVIRKYRSLGTNKQRNWDRIRLGTKDLSTLRAQLNQHATSLATFLITVLLESVDKIGQNVAELPQVLKQSLPAALGNLIETQSADDRSTRASVMTSYENDDKHVWRQFRRELVKSGVKSDEIKKHRDQLKRFLADLTSPDNVSDHHPEGHTPPDVATGASDLPPVGCASPDMTVGATVDSLQCTAAVREASPTDVLAAKAPGDESDASLPEKHTTAEPVTENSVRPTDHTNHVSESRSSPSRVYSKRPMSVYQAYVESGDEESITSNDRRPVLGGSACVECEAEHLNGIPSMKANDYRPIPELQAYVESEDEDVNNVSHVATEGGEEVSPVSNVSTPVTEDVNTCAVDRHLDKVSLHSSHQSDTLREEHHVGNEEAYFEHSGLWFPAERTNFEQDSQRSSEDEASLSTDESDSRPLPSDMRATDGSVYSLSSHGEHPHSQDRSTASADNFFRPERLIEYSPLKVKEEHRLLVYPCLPPAWQYRQCGDTGAVEFEDVFGRCILDDIIGFRLKDRGDGRMRYPPTITAIDKPLPMGWKRKLAQCWGRVYWKHRATGIVTPIHPYEDSRIRIERIEEDSMTVDSTWLLVPQTEEASPPHAINITAVTARDAEQMRKLFRSIAPAGPVQRTLLLPGVVPVLGEGDIARSPSRYMYERHWRTYKSLPPLQWSRTVEDANPGLLDELRDCAITMAGIADMAP